MLTISIIISMLLCCGGGGSALMVEHPRLQSGRYYHPSHLLQQEYTSTTLFSSTSKERAIQLIEENSMPLDDNDDMNDPLSQYDEDDTSPTESEFMNLISTFQSYSDRDIQSLSTTSTRYLHYKEPSGEQHNAKRSRRNQKRTKEDGIRYRTLYSGVQAASLEPEVLRAFIVLFEDYMPIRLAGRRIYRHLNNVMDEVREERMGEMIRAREICTNWDCSINVDIDGRGEVKNIIEYGRQIWDTMMDEALLLENSLDSVAEEEQSQEGGVISLPQLAMLGIDKVLIQDGIVDNTSELESIVRKTSLQEELEIEMYYNPKKKHKSHKDEEVPENGEYLEMTFPIFMRVLYQCTQQKEDDIHDSNKVCTLLQKMEQKALDHRTSSGLNNKDISTTLASKAVLSGNNKKRARFSKRFDEYVSTFQLWESKFLQHDNSKNTELGEQEEELPRRFEILKGCFVGARNERNVAALKIVYMDYAALRVGGDLIFQLMSKIANKIM